MDHPNMNLKREKGLKKKQVKKAIKEDGALVIEVQCGFVIHHAADVEVDKDSLAELLNHHLSATGVGYIDPINVDSYKVIDTDLC